MTNRNKTTITTAIFADQQARLYQLSTDLDTPIAGLLRTALDHWFSHGAPMRPSALQSIGTPEPEPDPEEVPA